MTPAVTLTGDDIDAAASALALHFMGYRPHAAAEVAGRLAMAADTQPSAPQAQLLLRLLAESIHAQVADPEVTQ